MNGPHSGCNERDEIMARWWTTLDGARNGRRLWGLLLVVALLVILAGCAGTSFSASCNNRTDSGSSRCDIELSSLNGSWSRDVNMAYVEATGPLPMHVEITVSSGKVRVSYPVVDGTTATEEITPDTPLTLDTLTVVTNEQVTVTFDSVDGSASGVHAVIEIGPA